MAAALFLRVVRLSAYPEPGEDHRGRTASAAVTAYWTASHSARVRISRRYSQPSWAFTNLRLPLARS
jgi:hypothetical protein